MRNDKHLKFRQICKRVVALNMFPVSILVALSPLLIIIYFFVDNWMFDCSSAPLKTWTDVDGLDFAYVQMDCDTLAKSLTHELQIGVHGWRSKERVFLIEPADDNLVPSVAIENGAIVVDLPAVDDIIMAKSEWRGRPIRYHIGHIRYPDALDPADIQLNLK